MLEHLNFKFALILIVIGIVIAYVTPAPARELSHLLVMQENIKGAPLTLIGLMVCGDAESEARGLQAAIAVAQKSPGWKRYLRDETCRSDYDVPAIATGNVVTTSQMFGTRVLESVVVDVLAYVVVPPAKTSPPPPSKVTEAPSNGRLSYLFK